MIEGVKEILNQAEHLWQNNYMDVFVDIKNDKITYTITPMKYVNRHFDNIRQHVNVNQAYVTTLYSPYKFNESILESLAQKAKDNFLVYKK
jgi:hypothetical protein